MTPTITLHEGDCRVSLRHLIDQGVRVHSVVTDPPYHLESIVKRFGKAGAAPAKHGRDGAYARASAGFISRRWDGADENGTRIAQDPDLWRLIYDILLPGGMVFAFSGARTGHWQACAMEMAGFIMHPMHGWLNGSGMPKAHNPKLPGWEGWRYGAQTQKPALENVYLGQKPRDTTDAFLDLIQSALYMMMEIPSCREKALAPDLISNASTAELISTLNGHGLIEPSIAQVLAPLLRSAANEAQTGVAVDMCGLTDTLLSALVTNMCSNTVRSWLTALAALWSLGNTFTIAITPEVTTDLKTWKSLTGRIIRGCTTHLNEPIGDSSNVTIAGSCLKRACVRLLSRVGTIATEIAIAPLAPVAPDRVGAAKVRLEPAYLGQKPFSEKNGVLNLLKHGVGAFNIDDCRAPSDQGDDRWPANLLHDDSEAVCAIFPDSKSDTGSAARFFNSFPTTEEDYLWAIDAGLIDDPEMTPAIYHGKATKADRAGSRHPTVKPISLMEHFIRHITPPGGTVLDPFGGSGTTAEAARRLGMNAIIMEAEPDYIAFLRERFDLDSSPENTAPRSTVSQFSRPTVGADIMSFLT